MTTDLIEGLDDDLAAMADDTLAEVAEDATPVEDAAPEATDDAPADDAESVAEDAAPVEDAPVSEPPVPFAVNVWGQPYQVPGAVFDKQHRTLAFADDKAFQRATQLMAAGREMETHHRRELASVRQQLERVRSEPDEEKIQAATYLEQFKALMTMSEQELYDFCLNARVNWPKIEAQADKQYAQRIMEQARTANQPPEPDVESLIEEAQSKVPQFIQQVLANETWATPDAREELSAILSDPQMLNQFVYRSNRDVPEFGIRAGQWVADWDRAASLLANLQKPYQRAATATQTATQRVQSTQAVAQTNARALARAKPATPPPAPKKPAAAPTRPQDVVRDAMQEWARMNR